MAIWTCFLSNGKMEIKCAITQLDETETKTNTEKIKVVKQNKQWQTQKSNRIRNIYLHTTDDGRQAMREELRDKQLNKSVMYIGGRSKWQCRLWSIKPCSNHDIKEKTHAAETKSNFCEQRTWRSNTVTHGLWWRTIVAYMYHRAHSTLGKSWRDKGGNHN